MGTKKKKREDFVKVRLTDTEKDRVVRYVAGLSPPQSLSSWLRGFIWREVKL